ncbi:unnamed protein product [Ceratitis capitata]|uniref:(Mediterranean fruit fly) hypothetical protein n=1 Tax=Ceratitis capitata TaxID=7213 RepID=A0A811U2T4_CERCA|nr:unnamed protein product [Ceratitis capitata]
MPKHNNNHNITNNTNSNTTTQRLRRRQHIMANIHCQMVGTSPPISMAKHTTSIIIRRRQLGWIPAIEKLTPEVNISKCMYAMSWCGSQFSCVVVTFSNKQPKTTTASCCKKDPALLLSTNLLSTICAEVFYLLLQLHATITCIGKTT